MEQPSKRAKPGRTPAPAGRTSQPRQAEVARLARVSQATVSLVLSARRDGRGGDRLRGDPSARPGRGCQSRERTGPGRRPTRRDRNNLLGVFGSTATFPTDAQHSYCPLLVGVEREAAARGYDLVLFTGSSTGGAGSGGPVALSRVRLAAVEAAGGSQPGTTLIVISGQAHPSNWVGVETEPIRPAHVAAGIREALAQGWNPIRHGSPFQLDRSAGSVAQS